MPTANPASAPTILIIGASRGLGHAMAAEFVKRDWNAVGTVRGDARTGLHDLANYHPGRVEIEQVDIASAEQVAALRERLHGRRFEILFVNAGTASGSDDPIDRLSAEAFATVMTVNALGVMRVVEGLRDLVSNDGILGVMSSGQGSIANNTKGGHDVYRASKAALNMLMRSHAARHADDPRALVLLAPGWIRTDLGGPKAPFSIEESIPKVVDVLLAQKGKPGLQFLDRNGNTVPW